MITPPTSVHVPDLVRGLYDPLGAVKLPGSLPVQPGVSRQAAVVKASLASPYLGRGRVTEQDVGRAELQQPGQDREHHAECCDAALYVVSE